PDTFRALVSMLDRMQDKHRFMVRALTHRYRTDRADAFLDAMLSRIDALRATITNGGELAAVVVMRAESVVESETRRLLERLSAPRIRVAAVVVNAATPHHRIPRLDAGRSAQFVIPRAHQPPRGLDAVLDAVGPLRKAVDAPTPSRARRTTRSARSS